MLNIYTVKKISTMVYKLVSEFNMKIAVSSNGQNLDSTLNPNFGKCSYYLIVDPGDMTFEMYTHDAAALDIDPGIQTAKNLVAKGVNAVITGHCGTYTMTTLLDAGIELYIGQSGAIKGVIKRFNQKKLVPVQNSELGSPYSMVQSSSVKCSRRRKSAPVVENKESQKKIRVAKKNRSKYSPSNDSKELRNLKREIDQMNKEIKKMMERMYQSKQE
jgi:predicted Fe-Mo cluster-binding NifX family protein